MIKVAVAIGLTVVGAGALLAGPTAFAVLVLALAVALLVDLSALLGAAGARPILPVALVPGLVLPAMVAADVVADPAAGWDRIPGAFAVALLLGFALVLVFGRRNGAVAGLAATATVSLLVGLGASGILLLRGLPDGALWVAAVLALVLAADGAAPLLRRLAGARDDLPDLDDPDLQEPAFATDPAALEAVLPAVGAVVLVGAVLALAIGDPLTPLVVVLLALVAVVAALGGAHLHRALCEEGGADPDAPEPRVGGGLVLGALDAVVIAAPAAYVLARSVVL
jgi:CDP-diglyceride synthetase